MCDQEYSEKGTFSEQGSDLSRSEIRVSFLTKGMFIVKRLRKGCNSTTMNFRDMGPFENPLVIHGNIGFNISGPPGGCLEAKFWHAGKVTRSRQIHFQHMKVNHEGLEGGVTNLSSQLNF